MNQINCSFCNKQNIFSTHTIKASGKAELITCSECKRSINVGFNGEKFYEKLLTNNKLHDTVL